MQKSKSSHPYFGGTVTWSCCDCWFYSLLYARYNVITKRSKGFLRLALYSIIHRNLWTGLNRVVDHYASSWWGIIVCRKYFANSFLRPCVLLQQLIFIKRDALNQLLYTSYKEHSKIYMRRNVLPRKDYEPSQSHYIIIAAIYR